MTETARTTWIRTLLIALLGIVMLGLSPVMAVADDGSEALGFKTESYATGPYASFASYRAEDGAVGYCLDYGKAAPSSSGFTSYDQGWNWVEGVANVIAYNGYPNTTTIAGHELDRDQARCATQLALWMNSESVGPDGISASGTSFTGAEGRTEITEAARDLYNKAISGELTAPRYAKRYESSNQRQSMLWAPATFSLTIGKRDSATKGTAQPGASLEGAEYRLVSLTAPDFEKTGTTDSNGTLTFGNVPTGTIQVTETKAPAGYRLDPEPRTYTVSNEDAENGDHIELVPENDFLEHVIAFDVQISKFTDDDTNDGSGLETPAGGVAFDLISNSTGEAVGQITTDEQGYASTEGQWFGLGTRPEGVNGALPYDCKGYTVHEVEETVPEGFEALDDWTIEPDQMEDGAVLRYIADNHILSSKLQIAKVDAESNAIVPKAGFSFQILKENGSPVTQDDWRQRDQKDDTFTTDESGIATLPAPLKPGKYAIRETAAPAPYLIAKEDTAFEVKDGAGADPEVLIRVADQQAKGRATIEKTDADTGNVLAGAEFDVIALEDVISPDGTVRARKDEVVDHVVTDENGLGTTSDLYLGGGTATYAFVETKAPDGYQLDADPVAFELNYQDSNTPIVTANVSVDNEALGDGSPKAPADEDKTPPVRMLDQTGALPLAALMAVIAAASGALFLITRYLDRKKRTNRKHYRYR